VVYHMLLGGQIDLERVNELWTDDLGPLLAGAVDELHGIYRTYLMARLGRRVSPDMLGSLPALALSSVLRGQGRSVLERYPPEAVVTLLDKSITGLEPELINVRLEALYRSGRWRDMLAVMKAGVELVSRPSRFLLRWATRDERAAASLVPGSVDIAAWASRVATSLSQSDTLWDFATFACAVTGRGGNAQVGPAVMAIVSKVCEGLKRLPAAANDGGALRILAIFDDAASRPILHRVDFASHFSTVSGQELRVLASLVEQARAAPPTGTAFPRISWWC
jgi:hypothetical protein